MVIKTKAGAETWFSRIDYMRKKIFNKQDLMQEKHCRKMNTIQYDNGCIGSRIMAMIQGLKFFFPLNILLTGE